MSGGTGVDAAALAATLVGLAVAALVPPDSRARLRPRSGTSDAAGPRSVRGSLGRNRSRASGRTRTRRPGTATKAPPAGSRTPVPVVTDLVAAALLTGLPPRVAVEAVASALEDLDDEAAEPLRHNGSGYAPLGEALDLAEATGLGPVPLVQAAATQSRRRRAAAQQVAARRAGTLVVLPTGLCLLPAFVLLTVAPLVLDLLLQ